MPNLPQRCIALLSQCDEFESFEKLLAFCLVSVWLRPLVNHLPEDRTSKQSRVTAFVAYLFDKTHEGQPLLALVCDELSERYHPQDQRHAALKSLVLALQGAWAPAAQGAVLASVLPPPVHFVGREELLTHLRQHLLQGQSVSLHGMGGVGKSGLAQKLCQTLLEAYPRQYQFALTDRREAQHPQAKDPRYIQAEIIQALAPDCHIPTDAAASTRLYQAVLRNQKVLLLLEDVHSSQQITPLIPPPPNVLVITSRANFWHPRLQPLPVPEFTPAEAQAFLQKALPTLAAADAETLARLSGGLPLALAAIASLLRRAKFVAKLIRELEAERWRLMKTQIKDPELSLEACFNLSYKQLPPAWQRAFRQLSVFTAPFTVPVAEAVGGNKVSEVLEELAALNLLRGHPQTEQYEWHDLLREFAYQLLRPAERQKAHENHARHYLAECAHAAQSYYGPRHDIRPLLQNLLTAGANLNTAFSWVCQPAAPPEAVALNRAYPVAAALGLAYLHLGQRAAAFQIWAQGLALEQTPTSAYWLRLLNAQGFHQGPPLAIENAQAVINLVLSNPQFATHPDYQRELAQAYNDLGVHAKVSHAEKLAYHEQSLALRKTLNVPHLVAESCHNIAVTWLYIYRAAQADSQPVDWQKTETWFQEALAIYEGIDDWREIGRVLLNWAWLELSRVQIANAQHKLQLALQHFIQIGHPELQAYAHHDLGEHIYCPPDSPCHDPIQAKFHLEQARTLYHQVNHANEADIQKLLARCVGL